MDSTLDLLLLAIEAAPEDWVRYLVAADRCDELGLPGWALALRWQYEQHKCPYRQVDYPGAHIPAGFYWFKSSPWESMERWYDQSNLPDMLVDLMGESPCGGVVLHSFREAHVLFLDHWGEFVVRQHEE